MRAYVRECASMLHTTIIFHVLLTCPYCHCRWIYIQKVRYFANARREKFILICIWHTFRFITINIGIFLSLSLTLTKWNHKYPNVLAGSQLLDIEKPKRQLDMRIEMCFRMCMAPDAYDLHCSEHQEKNHIWRRDAAPTSSRWMLPGIVCEKKWARASATVRERESEHFEG